MKKVLGSVLGVLVLIVAGVFGTAAFQSKDFHVERSVTSTASASTIYVILGDLGRFSEWSPYSKLDPSVKITTSTPSTGVGATYEWSGNDQVGSGRMTITESIPDQFVAMSLEFFMPFPATNTTKWSVTEEQGMRRITWAMDGRNESIIQRAFCLIMDMDKMVGGDFEKGLTNLKGIVEAM